LEKWNFEIFSKKIFTPSLPVVKNFQGTVPFYSSEMALLNNRSCILKNVIPQGLLMRTFSPVFTFCWYEYLVSRERCLTFIPKQDTEKQREYQRSTPSEQDHWRLLFLCSCLSNPKWVP